MQLCWYPWNSIRDALLYLCFQRYVGSLDIESILSSTLYIQEQQTLWCSSNWYLSWSTPDTSCSAICVFSFTQAIRNEVPVLKDVLCSSLNWFVELTYIYLNALVSPSDPWLPSGWGAEIVRESPKYGVLVAQSRNPLKLLFFLVLCTTWTSGCQVRETLQILCALLWYLQ